MKNKQTQTRQGVAELTFSVALAILTVVFDTLLCTYTKVHPVFIAVFSVAIIISATISFYIIRKNTTARRKRTPAPETVSVLAGAVVDLPHPAFICAGENDGIVWSNKEAARLFGAKAVRFSDLFSTLESDEESGEALRLGALGRRFAPTSYISEGTDGRDYRVFIMHDVTEYDAQTALLRGRESAVAYITVDNLDELLNYEQEDYRSASGETERILRAWATEAGGILKEYQQDKYIFVFERSHLAEFTRNGFDILDKIRDIRVGENSIPLTVSMGVCASDGAPLEKEKAAQSALDTALQRGGDQVVLKADGAVEIFGGKTKIPQKRTKVKARVVANELVSRISSSSNVIIMGHKYADFDAFGACVGLARLCMFCGVPVNIVTDFADSNLDRCRSWIGREKEYAGVFINGETAMDLITSDTLLLVADVNNKFQFECPALLDHCLRVCIVDHHRKTADYERAPLITYIEPAASAASELVAEMLEQVLPADELLSVEANLMMAGILLDTNQFTKNTGTRTFSAALYLRGRGADVGEVQELFKTELSDFQRELKFHSNVEIYRGVAAIAVAEGECTFKDKIPAAKAADKLLTVEGVKASFAIVPIGGEVHISARSTGTINVQLLLEKLRGGGHFDSAGTRLEGITVKEAADMLKSAIDSYLDENNQDKDKGDKKQ
ncbi:MAG: DHH family phosphoesterase [Clostridia bacterium]|nr:DHH family phosphoesterase [Clostridia bacterium]